MGKVIQKIPALRLPEFNQPWNICKLEDIAEIYDGTHQTPKYTDQGVPFVSVENISNLGATNKFIADKDFEKNFKVKPKKDDILMTRITAGVIGATALVESDKPLAYYVSLALIRCRNGVTPRFLEQRINCGSFRRELHKRIIHVAFPKKINLGDIGKCEVSLPEIDEQAKIENFLSALNNRITFLQRKHMSLKGYKLGILRCLLTKELRFKQDDGSSFPEWRRIKINKLFDWAPTNNLSREKLTEESGTVQNIHYGDIHTKFSSHFFQNAASAPYVLNEEAKFHEHAFCRKGDIIIADASEDYADIGKAIEIMEVKDRTLVAGLHTYIARPREQFAPGFTGYLFQESSVRKAIKRLAQGISVLGISKTNLEKVELPYPHPDEQKKITTMLMTIDRKIAAVEQQIHKVERFKQGLLQQMFV